MSDYLLRAYVIEDFLEAFETAYKEKPEVYWYMVSILRKQGYRVSEEDMKLLRQEPAPLKIMIPNIVIEEPIAETIAPTIVSTSTHSDPDFGCNHCGFHHPDGTCMDS